MQRDDGLAGDVAVDLDRLAVVHPVVDDEHVIAVVVDLRALAELARVLQGQFVEAEDVAELIDGLDGGVVEVEPEELVAGAQLGDGPGVQGGQRAHVANAECSDS